LYGLFFAITILISSVFLLIYLIIFGNKITMKNRLEEIKNYNTIIDYKESETIKVGKKKDNLSVFRILGKIIPFDRYLFKKKELLSGARLLLKPEELLGMSLIVSLILGLILFIFINNILFFLIGCIIGYKIPTMYVKRVKKKRAKKLNAQLPVALSVIANGLRAGLSFNQAMIIASKEMDPPISDDFKKIVHDNSLGKEMEEALKDFAERTADDDVEILVTAVLIQRQVGGNLSEILDTISNTIRERAKLKGDIKTMTAQSKLSAVIIGAIPFFIIIILYLINKEFLLPLFTTLIGNVLLGIAILMQALGIFVLVKILDFKV